MSRLFALWAWGNADVAAAATTTPQQWVSATGVSNHAVSPHIVGG